MCDCIKRTGKIEIETRDSPTFDKLIIYDNVNVFVSEDTILKVEIEAGKNLIELISTEVVNGTLIIKNKNRCNWTRSYKKSVNIYLSMPAVTSIISEGIGTIKSLNTLTTSEIKLRTKSAGNIDLNINNSLVLTSMNSTGDISLSGFTSTHLCDIGGTAFLNCKSLITNYTWVHSFTTGICYVNTSSTIECRLDNIGDLHCFGGPTTIIKELNAKGKIYLK